MPIYNRLKILIAEKEIKENRKITYKDIQEETGVAASTLSAWATNSIGGYDRSTIEKLCGYFNCAPGDLIVKIND